jgi:preprotein translocase subunit SecA
MAAQVQHLRKIGVDVGSDPIWAISLDDLRVYGDIFENHPLIFLQYVEQRMRAFQSNLIQSDDELDHLGLYLKHNHYGSYAEQLRGKSAARLTFTGYRSNIDRFFNERMFDPHFPCPLKQSIPARILQIVEFLSKSTLSGRAAISSYLLDLDEETRARIANNIENELANQPTQRRAKPFSTHTGVNLTVFCWTDSWAHRNAALAFDHARTVLIVGNDRRRLLLELGYTDAGNLKNVAWKWIDVNTIPPSELPRLRMKAEQLREARLLEARRASGGSGRNDPCPCGSGKKYKRCCLNT